MVTMQLLRQKEMYSEICNNESVDIVTKDVKKISSILQGLNHSVQKIRKLLIW